MLLKEVVASRVMIYESRELFITRFITAGR
jgi:hypothetical protein